METNNINSFLVLITGDIDNFMYTYILVALLVFTGIYFTIRTKGAQFRYIKDMQRFLLPWQHRPLLRNRQALRSGCYVLHWR